MEFYINLNEREIIMKFEKVRKDSISEQEHAEYYKKHPIAKGTETMRVLDGKVANSQGFFGSQNNKQITPYTAPEPGCNIL